MWYPDCTRFTRFSLQVRLFAAEITLALGHLHSLGVIYRSVSWRDVQSRTVSIDLAVYSAQRFELSNFVCMSNFRDLKPENVLLTTDVCIHTGAGHAIC